MIIVCISTKANAEMLFKGPWALYPNSVDKMDLYFETDTGVDNDYNHRRDYLFLFRYKFLPMQIFSP
jgi:hypothetical protein